MRIYVFAGILQILETSCKALCFPDMEEVPDSSQAGPLLEIRNLQVKRNGIFGNHLPVPVMDQGYSTFWHTLLVQSVRLLDGWEAVPLAAPLPRVDEAKRIKRPWVPVRVPGHWQLEDAFAAYEGFVLGASF